MENSCEQRELKGSRLYGYAFGVIGQILPTALINSYLFMFYTYTVGLDSFIVNLATGISTLLNGMLAPVFGYLGDRKKPGKFGKRKPFILGPLPLMLVSFILLWMPPVPSESVTTPSIIFLFVFIIAFFIQYPMLRSAYLALMPELSTVQSNRIKISSFQALISIFGSVLGILLPIILQSQLENPRNALYNTADGQFLMRFLPIIAIIFAAIALFFTLWTIISADESYLKIQPDSCTPTPEKKSLGQVFRSLLSPFTDRNFAIFLLATLLFNAAMRILVKILAPYLTFVLELQGNQFNIFTFSLLPFAAVGFLFWQKFIKKRGLKKSYLNSTLLISAALSAAILLFIPLEKQLVWALTYIFVGLALTSMVAGYILPNPIIGQLADTTRLNATNSKTANSGSYFGAWLLTLNVSNTLGDLLLGGILSGNERNPIVLKALFPITAVLFFISYLFIRKIQLK